MIASPSLDALFGLLADRRRRYAIYCLSDAEDSAVLSTDRIAEAVLERERKWGAVEDSTVRSGEDAIRIELHHEHLPRLDDAGLIEYDPQSETVRGWEEPTFERWIDDDSPELPRLRALLGVGDGGDGNGDGRDGGDGNGDVRDGDDRDGDVRDGGGGRSE